MNNSIMCSLTVDNKRSTYVRAVSCIRKTAFLSSDASTSEIIFPNSKLL